MPKISALTSSILASALLLSTANAVELAPLFSDHMVFQRNVPLNLTGTADPRQTVTVNFEGKQHSAQTDPQGQWQIALPSQKAGGPYQITVSTSDDSKSIQDVYFGDVWLASGQSNMEWKVGWKIDNYEAEIADSNFPLIRYFSVPNHFTASPQKTLQAGEWKLASPKTAAEFSAAAWFFAKHAHAEKGVPIGVIDSTWGGTPAEAWTSIEALADQPRFVKSAQELQAAPQKWETKFADMREQSNQKNALLASTNGHDVMKLSAADYDDSQWPTLRLPRKEQFSDIIWFRKHINVDSTHNAEQSVLHLGLYPQVSQVYINGTLVHRKESGDQPKPITFDSGLLQSGSNVIAIRAANAWSNQVNFGRHKQMYVEQGDSKISIEGDWQVNSTVEGKLPMPERYNQKTSVLYNAMIAPITHYPLKGVIWYQGESNIYMASEYHRLFSAMISDWRTRWNHADMPFIFAQLAGMNAIRPQPMESGWAELREAQTQTLALPNTAMAVLIDAGEAYDIHPRNKQIVGERLWHAADAIAYGSDNVYSGPSAKQIESNGHQIIVSYDDVGSGLINEGELMGFELAGKDGKYVNASAKVQGDKIVLMAAEVKQPKSVRYAWADNSAANLYNQEGFPAVPFRMGELPVH